MSSRTWKISGSDSGRIILAIGLIVLTSLSLLPTGIRAAAIVSYGSACCGGPVPLPICCPSGAGEASACIGQICGPTTEDQNGTCRRICTSASGGESQSCESGGEIKCVQTSSATTSDEEPLEIPANPRLSIDIPTVRFTDATPAGEQYIDFPWLADYISGLFRYAIPVAAILAVVMMMVGGLQWLTSAGDSGRVGAAKKRIMNAVVGLMLLVGSYLLLNTVNPELVLLPALRIKTVPPDPLILQLQNPIDSAGNPVATGTSNDSSYSIAGGTGTYQARYFTPGTCPVTLTAEGSGINSERNKEFFRLIDPLLHGTTGEKFAQAYEAAWLCGLNLGSCGRTISDLATLIQAGPNAGCLIDMSQQVIARLPGNRTGRIGCMDIYTTQRPISAVGYRELNTQHLSIRDFISALQERDPGYPDSISNQLQAGDIVIYYTDNSSLGGGHRVFVASINERGVAQLLNGDIRRPAYTSDVCFSTRCGNFAPIGVIHRLR